MDTDPRLYLLVAAFAGALITFVWVRSVYRTRLSEQVLVQDRWEEEARNQTLKLEQERERNLQWQIELSGARERLSRLAELESELDERNSELRQLEHQSAQQQEQIGVLQTRLQAEKQLSESREQWLQQARRQLKDEFQGLAADIIEKQTRQAGIQQQEKLTHLLTPFREQLGDFRRRVDDVYDRESKDRKGLWQQIEQLKTLNLQMSQEAVNLTQALRGDNKQMGSWGELVLERVLEASGLRRGEEFETQYSVTTAEGRRLQPDVVVHLPEGKNILVDAKVSLVAYEHYCRSEDPNEREAQRKQHLQSVRNHIRELSNKAYHHESTLSSLDFVLMFVPVEPAFILAMESDPQLVTEAMSRNVLVVCPSTLLVSLRTVANIWRNERQNRYALDIAARGGELYDKFVGFVEAFEEVGRTLAQSQRSFDMARKRLSEGRGNLVSRAEGLKELGIKHRKDLPEAFLTDEEETNPDGS